MEELEMLYFHLGWFPGVSRFRVEWMVGQKQMDGTNSLQASTESRTGASHWEQLPSWQPLSGLWPLLWLIYHKTRDASQHMYIEIKIMGHFSPAIGFLHLFFLANSYWFPSLILLANKEHGFFWILRGIFGNLAVGIFQTLVCPRTEWEWDG